MDANIRRIKEKILPLLKDYGVERAGLFGSCVIGQMRKDSDIDILVEIKRDVSLLDFIELKQKIEEVLRRKVDLVEYDTVKPLLKDKIFSQQVVIL